MSLSSGRWDIAAGASAPDFRPDRSLKTLGWLLFRASELPTTNLSLSEVSRKQASETAHHFPNDGLNLIPGEGEMESS